MKNHIKLWRQFKKMSQEELAKKIGISRTAISQMEIGNYSCRVETALKLSKVLDKPVEKLFELEEKDYVVNEQSRRGV